MSGPSPILTKTFINAPSAAQTIEKRRLITPHPSNAGEVNQASGSSNPIIGVSAELDVDAGGRVDVHMAGIAELELGDAVDQRDPITSDTQGRGVDGTPAAGNTAWVVGIALASGVSGDIIPVLLAPHRMTTET